MARASKRLHRHNEDAPAQTLFHFNAQARAFQKSFGAASPREAVEVARRMPLASDFGAPLIFEPVESSGIGKAVERYVNIAAMMAALCATRILEFGQQMNRMALWIPRARGLSRNGAAISPKVARSTPFPRFLVLVGGPRARLTSSGAKKPTRLG